MERTDLPYSSPSSGMSTSGRLAPPHFAAPASMEDSWTDTGKLNGKLDDGFLINSDTDIPEWPSSSGLNVHLNAKDFHEISKSKENTLMRDNLKSRIRKFTRSISSTSPGASSVASDSSGGRRKSGSATVPPRSGHAVRPSSTPAAACTWWWWCCCSKQEEGWWT